MLPSWPELLGLVMLALIIVAAVMIMRQRGQQTAPLERSLIWDPTFGDALCPLFAPALLALPYLPWIPDWIPALRLLAGPGRWLLWGVVLGQIVLTLIRIPRGKQGNTNHLPASLAVFGISLLVYAGAFTRLTGTNAFPSGDEPHYLIITQSLLRDHDLKIENNHQRGDYREYFSAPLKPDYRTRGTDREIYSIHPVGLPVLAIPAFALAGYRGVVWLLMLLAAGTAALLWRWALALSRSAWAATFAWAAVCLSAPFVLNSFTVYPEIPAAFCVMLAAGTFVPAGSGFETRMSRARLWTAAIAVAALPWLSTKYAGIAVVLAGTLAWHHRRSVTKVGVVLGVLAVSLGGWLTFFYLIWGSPLPSAPYGPDSQTSLLTFASGGPGLLFDQEYGVCAYAPVLILGLVGLAVMWREHSMRRLAIELALAGLALLVMVGSFALWRGGVSMPGRPVIAMLPLFGAPIAWYYNRATEHPLRRASSELLLLISFAITLTLILAVNGSLVVQGRDGSSSLLEWLSPTWHLWAAAPTYVLSSPAAATAQSLLWLAGATLVAWRCRQSRTATPGRAALRATLSTAVAVTMIVSISPLLPGAREQPRFNPEARSSLLILDTFDAAARPTGVRYDPMSVVASSQIPPLFSLVALPGQRLARQPVRVLLNARFRLPAGKYEVELRGSDVRKEASHGAIGLQMGREGNPIETWPFAISQDHPWRQRFRLPLDTEFVAFRTSPDVEQTIARLSLRPLEIVDAPRRLQTEPVLSAGSYGSTRIVFHDRGAYPEAEGFWVRGQSTIRATLVKAVISTDSIPLSLHSGARPNRVSLTTTRWSTSVDLVPGVTQTIVVPSDPRQPFTPLAITTNSGFVPSEVQPGNPDHRLLGCWIAFPQ